MDEPTFSPFFFCRHSMMRSSLAPSRVSLHAPAPPAPEVSVARSGPWPAHPQHSAAPAAPAALPSWHSQLQLLLPVDAVVHDLLQAGRLFDRAGPAPDLNCSGGRKRGVLVSSGRPTLLQSARPSTRAGCCCRGSSSLFQLSPPALGDALFTNASVRVSSHTLTSLALCPAASSTCSAAWGERSAAAGVGPHAQGAKAPARGATGAPAGEAGCSWGGAAAPSARTLTTKKPLSAMLYHEERALQHSTRGSLGLVGVQKSRTRSARASPPCQLWIGVQQASVGARTRAALLQSWEKDFPFLPFPPWRRAKRGRTSPVPLTSSTLLQPLARPPRVCIRARRPPDHSGDPITPWAHTSLSAGAGLGRVRRIPPSPWAPPTAVSPGTARRSPTPGL